jgi:FkbM family methyltransferase
MLIKLIKLIVEPFPYVAKLLRDLRDLLDRQQPPETTPWGFKLCGHAQMASGKFEPIETKLVRNLLKDADVFVNVGANIGYYCCHALSLGKPCLAVEPIPRNIYYLLRNIQINGWKEMVEVFPVAAGSSASILNMWGGGTGASLIKGWASIPEGYMTQVPVLSLDRIALKFISGRRALILVDVEGSEYFMLMGAKEILNLSPRPIWMMEITTSQNQPQGVQINPNFEKTFDIFFDAGYKVFLANGMGIEVTKDDIKDIVRNKRSLNAYNFIFK